MHEDTGSRKATWESRSWGELRAPCTSVNPQTDICAWKSSRIKRESPVTAILHVPYCYSFAAHAANPVRLCTQPQRSVHPTCAHRVGLRIEHTDRPARSMNCQRTSVTNNGGGGEGPSTAGRATTVDAARTMFSAICTVVNPRAVDVPASTQPWIVPNDSSTPTSGRSQFPSP